jgi:SWIM zinc finger
MTQQQYEKRKERAQTEPLVISRTEEGFRVYSPAEPTKSYIVAGSKEAPTCTCPDFQYHEGDPQWQCKHILAVLHQLSKPNPQNGPDGYEATEREAIQDQAQLTKERKEKASAEPPSSNGTSQMLLKRSVSPDGRIDSLSVEFSCPVEKTSAREIKSRALKTLKLQSEIVASFLNGSKKDNGPLPEAKSGSGGVIPAQMLNIGGMDGKWGRRLFINVKVNGQTSKLFGNRKQLGEFIAAAGFASMADHIDEGMPLNLACRAITKPSEDGRFLNIERVLPLGGRR